MIFFDLYHVMSLILLLWLLKDEFVTDQHTYSHHKHKLILISCLGIWLLKDYMVTDELCNSLYLLDKRA